LLLSERTAVKLRALSLRLAVLPLLLPAIEIGRLSLRLTRHLLSKYLPILPLRLPVELRLLSLNLRSLLGLSVPLRHLTLHLRSLLLLPLYLRELALSLPIHLRHLPLHLRHLSLHLRSLCLLPHLRLLTLHLRWCLTLLLTASTSISSAVTASFPLRGNVAETAHRDHQQKQKKRN
jgi:hypothetical protein